MGCPRSGVGKDCHPFAKAVLSRSFTADLDETSFHSSVHAFGVSGFGVGGADGSVGEADGACDLGHDRFGRSIGGGGVGEKAGAERGSEAEIGGDYGEGERVDGEVARGAAQPFGGYFNATGGKRSGCVGANLSGDGELLS